MNVRAVLDRYSLNPTRVRLVAQRDNDVYRVDAQEGSFALRWHAPEANPADVAREMAWLEHLRPQLGTRVPHPTQTRQGAWLTEDGGRTVSLLSWVPGRFPKKPTRRLARAIGQTLAEIHSASESFVSSDGSRSWNDEGFFNESFLTKLKRVSFLVPDDEIAGFLAQGQAVREGMREMRGKTGEGLLHADLFGANCLFQSGTLAVIDFANAGIGPHAFDVAVAQRHLPIPMRAEVLRGYESRRPLDDVGRNALPLLRRARILQMAVYAADRLDRPGGYDPTKLVAFTLASLKAESAEGLT